MAVDLTRRAEEPVAAISGPARNRSLFLKSGHLTSSSQGHGGRSRPDSAPKLPGQGWGGGLFCSDHSPLSGFHQSSSV